MRSERKYIFILIGVSLLYFVVEWLSPKEIDWRVSLHKNDKNPYGSYLIHERLPDLFDKVEHSYLTIYELADTIDGNLFILSENFSPSPEDTKSLLSYIGNGNNAFIAANYFNQNTFLDTLGISLKNFIFNENIIEENLADTLSVNFSSNQLATTKGYPFHSYSINSYFETDSILTVLAETKDKPVIIHIKNGEGSLYLCSTPLAFTNNYLLHNQNNEFVSKALSYLPIQKLYWTEYYQTGRLESGSPLRYILSNESLRTAYYLVIISVLFFILFEIKRKQRIIPIISPLANTSLEFVRTLGNLYYRNSNHKNIAEKRILFFTEKLRTNYYFNSIDWSDEFMNEVSLKTGNDIDKTKALFEQISRIRNSTSINESELTRLNEKLDDFKIT